MASLGDSLPSLTKGIRADRTSRDVRRALADMAGFLNGVASSSGYANYTLNSAISDYIAELTGSPANGRLNKIERVRSVQNKAAVAISVAMLLEEDDLGSELVPEGSFSKLGGLLAGASSKIGKLPDSLPDSDMVDALPGYTGKASQAYSGDKLALAKDVLT